MALETYSDDLVRSSNAYHRLHVNISFLEQTLADAQEYLDAQAAMRTELTKEHEESFDVGFDGLVCEQLDSLKEIQKIEGENLKRLLQRESALPLTFQDSHPLVSSFPEWIADLFPYFQPQEMVESIVSENGHLVKCYDTAHECAVPSSVHDSFLQVWWPIASQVQEPGYLYKESDRTWVMKSLER
jgi:hypothetical protein